jgi:hypothetical protein
MQSQKKQEIQALVETQQKLHKELNPQPIKSAGLSPRQTINESVIKKESKSINDTTTDPVTMIYKETNNKA